MSLTYIFRIVYNLSDQTNEAQKLYDFLKKTLGDHLKFITVEKLKRLSGENFMKEYMKQYQDYLILAKWMTKVFNYID